ncbi:hypothetical protein CYMTET_41348, partial [Cymbomonas tetramitiformis]
DDGGALALGESLAESILDTNSLEGNEANGRGGAMALYANFRANISNCIFRNSAAKGAGGALFISTNATVTMGHGNHFIGNSGGQAGGALQCLAGTKVVFANLATLSENTAAQGDTTLCTA